MKHVLTFVSVLFLSSLGFASSSSDSKTRYDFRAVSLLNEARDCANELIIATENNQIVLDAQGGFEEFSDRTVRKLELTIGIRYPPPAVLEEPVSKLIITKTAKKRTGPIAPDMGPSWGPTECKLVSLEK